MQRTEIFKKELKNLEDKLQRSNTNLSTEGKAKWKRDKREIVEG